MKPEEILEQLNITEDVVNIYPYGSHLYGTANEDSDRDYIIVTKGALLKSGGFSQNAISNEDGSIQGVLYSRGGFQDAINTYTIGALECLSLTDEQVVMRKWPFKMNKWDEKEMVKNVISKVSASWFSADFAAKNDNFEKARKGIFHSLRILLFGMQLKENKKIINFGAANFLKEMLDSTPDDKFDTRDFIKLRDDLMAELRK